MRFALRLCTRRPAVPLLVAALFALGVGLASGMWAVIDAAVLRPLPYRDGAALVAVLETHPQRGLMAVTPANFLDWSTRVRNLQDVAGLYALDCSVAGAGPPERVSGTKVTERFFDLWGVPPTLGRILQRNDFAAGGRVVVLGHALWARHFNGDVHALGALLGIDGEAYTVVGVMPASFRTIDKAEIWIPWMMSADEQRERRFHLVGTIARLQKGVTASGAERELATMYRQLQIDHPETTADWSAQSPAAPWTAARRFYESADRSWRRGCRGDDRRVDQHRRFAGRVAAGAAARVRGADGARRDADGRRATADGGNTPLGGGGHGWRSRDRHVVRASLRRGRGVDSAAVRFRSANRRARHPCDCCAVARERGRDRSRTVRARGPAIQGSRAATHVGCRQTRAPSHRRGAGRALDRPAVGGSRPSPPIPASRCARHARDWRDAGAGDGDFAV